jgi:hypothetical protein
MHKLPVVCLVLAGCTADVDILTEDTNATAGSSIISSSAASLSGCRGQASSSIPSDGRYVITTFGGPGDHQSMSCGGYADGTGWYAASRQRYGCGARVKLEANGKCVVLQTDDYGPDVCVENAAGKPIIDVTPRASQYLFGTSSAGWSDRMVVTVTKVATGTPLGPCSSGGGTSGGGTGTPPPTEVSCPSSTLDRDVTEGTCVQSATDGEWYECSGGDWIDSTSSATCTSEFAYCSSATLGIDVPPRTCVQAASNGVWYQCNGQRWVTPVSVSSGSGPIGDCSTMHPL